MKTYDEYVSDLLESRTFTHEMNKSVSILIKWLDSYKLKYDIDKNKDTQDFQLYIYNNDNFSQSKFENIITICENFGYFPCLIKIDNRNLFDDYKEYSYFKKNITNNKKDIDYINFIKGLTFDIFNEIYFQFERYKDLDVDIDNIPDILYHVCRTNDLEKIEKYGLKPSSKNKISYHPERIYLTENGAKSLIKQFKDIDNTDYNIIKIYLNDDSKKHIQLKNDTNFDDGYYTLTNIPPSWFER